ncbi:TadE family protein [uncultured Shewanella sp.]|uniref:TadE family protein n=1 Tax=uncultured Shewanella sp. TaxID=173975 RepID=UPI00262C5D09|nr:TadE/TadG family type IV pilus assembly protein [uncultured Shewanella sp.]
MFRLSGFQKQKGLATIEFTLLVPFFLLIIFATAEFGRGLYQYSQLTRMIRDAARHLSQSVITTGNGVPADSTGKVLDANCNNCITETKMILKHGANSVSPLLLNEIDTAVITIEESPLGSGIMVISVDYDWSPIFFDQLSGFGLGDGIDLSFNLNSTYAVRAI